MPAFMTTFPSFTTEYVTSPRQYFLTEYRLEKAELVNGARYHTYLLARDLDEAKALIELRRKGEILIDNGRPIPRRGSAVVPILQRLTNQLDRLERARTRGDDYALRLMHTVMHCSDLACGSDRWDIPKDAFSDDGLYHQLTHLFDADTRADILRSPSNIKKLRVELTSLEEAVPEMFRLDTELKHNLPKE